LKQIFLLLVMIFTAASFAAAETLPTEVPYLHDVPKNLLPTLDPPLALRLHLGHFNGEKVSEQLTGESGGFTFGVGAHLFPKEKISYLMEIFSLQRDYDMPASSPAAPFATTFDGFSLDTRALLLGVRATFPNDQILRLHATGGIGFFNSELAVKATSWGFPVEKRASDYALGWHAGMGIDAIVNDWIFGVEFRHWFVDGNFGNDFEAFGIDDVNLGGGLYSFSIGKMLY
jgi:hypothetical protein